MVKRRSEHGYITAETAVALPALVVVLCAMVWGVATVTAQVKCVDAARAGARALARGELPGEGRAEAVKAAPSGADVVLSRTGAYVRVDVSATINPPGPVASLFPGFRVHAEAVAAAEDVEAVATAGDPDAN